MNRQNDHAADTVLKRLLLAPGQSWYPENTLLAVVSGDEHEVRVSLTAPRMVDAGLVAIRQMLVARLRGALDPFVDGDTPPNYDEIMAEEPEPAKQTEPTDDWIYMVREEKSSSGGDREVVVRITDPATMGARSMGIVLRHVRGILLRAASKYARRLVLLQGDQRFVPLDFDVDDMRRSSVWLTLPAELRLIRPRFVGDRYGVKYDADEVQYAANYLEAALVLALDPIKCVTSVGVNFTPAIGVRIDVNLGGRHGASAGDLNAVQARITQIVSRHAFISEGLFRWLVFAPAGSHYDELGDYDDSDRYEEY